MIEIRALLDQTAGLTSIEVTGHGRRAVDDIDGAAACASVSACTQTSIAFLHALAEQYPDHVRFTLKEIACPP